MRETLEWVDRGGELHLELDDAAAGGGRYLAVRRAADEGLWQPLAVLLPGEPEREIGEGVAGPELAQDVAVKYAIQALAAIHGFSPAPGTVDEGAPEPERLVAALWGILRARLR
jgi:hypothetical protein